MSDGEGKAPKSLELLIQVSAWTGGILAAAVGGFLVAFGSKDTPPEIVGRFKWAVIPLVLALLGTWYIQIHAALRARELELDDTNKADSPPADQKEGKKKSSRPLLIRWSIYFQVGCQTIALLAIALGVYFYQGAAPEPWTLVASQSNDRQISYLLKVRIPRTTEAAGEGEESKTGTLQPRLLVSDANDNWRVCDIDLAAQDDHVQCPSKSAPAQGNSMLQRIGDPILFHRLQYKLKDRIKGQIVDLTDAVCQAKRTLLSAHAGGVLVIGSHDRDRIIGGASVDSNESLARLRASSVASFLAQNNTCGPSIDSVIALNSAPVLATKEVDNRTDLSMDRSVSIYGLVSSAATPPTK